MKTFVYNKRKFVKHGLLYLTGAALFPHIVRSQCLPWGAPPTSTNSGTQFISNVTANTTQNANPYTVGYSFTVGASPIVVKSLALYNANASNTGTHLVGIWNSSSVLQCQTSTGFNLTGVALGAWSITTALSAYPTLAASALYYIGELEITGDYYLNISNAGGPYFSQTGVATVGSGMYSAGSTFAAPTNSSGSAMMSCTSFGY